jgi:hypothetical protein
MKLQNGYKVIYEKAADGKRTFYASKNTKCDPTVDKQLGDAFVDADYAGKVIYEYKGSFYISTGKAPAYDENGVPTDERLSAFDEVFVKAEPATPAAINESKEEPEPEKTPEETPEPEDTEPEPETEE